MIFYKFILFYGLEANTKKKFPFFLFLFDKQLPFMKHANGFIFQNDILTTDESVRTSIITNALMCSIATTLRHCNKQAPPLVDMIIMILSNMLFAEPNEISLVADECQLDSYDNNTQFK